MLCLDLAGRTYVVTGVTNERSIAWAIAEKLAAGGANLLFTYRLERSGEALRRLIPALPGEGNHRLFSVDVERDADIEALATFVREEGISLAGLVHSVAFARKEELDGAFIDTSREGFLLAHNVSVYSLVALARALRPAFHPGAAVVTLTYLGSERVVPHYNVMGVAKAALEASVRYLAYDLGEDGVRVNAVSAGPVRTLSARGIAGFTRILGIVEERAPLRRNITAEEVANAALFLLTDWSSGITGEVLYVDAGYGIMGL
ncbi:MAG: Enoyl-[acyl-carrier-protein] reductase [NADH] [Brockia lithotrophica]|uniref:Enoyl-[acyl-carrier-protein] reductase [NADH] n=1 Tax=Brockia lithotrophica TaxID=933949 RepID=A0A2T5G7K3_9BACL|nr:SDR family oxidoreductase [Brockia lithotrophica]MBT9253254.1 SDR family oxidoreductase [Brockia lithotrophica]PTQ52176.1 MAG: Enoyl-[acyl-carrier-protein] reductase [NADH] [Brockia lithotrophica]